MLQSTKTAEQQISSLILRLKNEKKFININELISILENTKSICKNKTILNTIIQSIEILLYKDLKHKIKLTRRETQIIELIGKGLQNTEIAIALTISKSTVETHRKNIRKKLKLKGNDSLYAFALIFCLQYQNGIVDDNF